jgi:hypothetical protein
MKQVIRPLTPEARARIGEADPVRANFRSTSYSNGYSRDRVPWPQTLDLLEREIGALMGRKSWQLDDCEYVLQVDVREDEIRLDGQIRANARPGSPAVAVSFEPKDGPLLFVCGRFDHWQDNVRAIAKGLEALRMVDRYGITQSDEQYRGFRALPSGVPMPAPKMTLEDAARFLILHGDCPTTVEKMLSGKGAVDVAYRRAAKKLHPDAGGDAELFTKATEARNLIVEACG